MQRVYFGIEFEISSKRVSCNAFERSLLHIEIFLSSGAENIYNHLLSSLIKRCVRIYQNSGNGKT